MTIGKSEKMMVFVIHRFKKQKDAKKYICNIGKEMGVPIKPILLNSVSGKAWQDKARRNICKAEAIIVYNEEECAQSDNCRWEIELARKQGKKIIIFQEDSDNNKEMKKLCAIYNFSKEFEKCFSTDNKNAFDLYKLMIETSEQLIIRRQRTNTFFVTLLGTLITVAGILINSNITRNYSSVTVGLFSIVSILLCISWHNLISNYGKLNKAKFEVINKLEENFGNKIFTAEWVALGKGVRKKKYQSFTATEKNLPLYFVVIIIAATFIYFCGDNMRAFAQCIFK